MRKLVAIALGVAYACTPIRPRPSPTAPINACADHPCSAYSVGRPTCVVDVCLEPPTPEAPHLVLVVAIPTDAQTLPGFTYAISFANLRSKTVDGGIGPLPSGSPGTPPTFPLTLASAIGAYLVLGSTTRLVEWNLGNLDTAKGTSIPVHATYRPLWPPDNLGVDAGMPSPMDAVNAGLPLEPVQAESVPSQDLGQIANAIGPAHSPATDFHADLEPDLPYEQTIAPDPPFDQAYPPDVSIVRPHLGQNFVPNDSFGTRVYVSPDATGGNRIPTFELSRADGLDGWTAHLRDATTKRAISPVRPLSGTTTTHVLLPTSHHPASSDALSNAELVMTPPDGALLPAYVLAPQLVSPRQTYPLLPAPVTMSGRIEWSEMNAVAADVIFEATGIYAYLPSADRGDAGSFMDSGDPASAGDAGPAFTLQPGNFEYTARTTAEPDPSVPGTSTYELTLPRGGYRVIVRPRDVPSVDPSAHAVSIFEGIDVGSSGKPRPPTLFVGVTNRVSGTAVVADGRALASAFVEAVPIHCSMPNGLVPASNDVPSCMPRYQSTTTANDGTFSLSLDPGSYLIRAEPADGTRLPWVSQTIHVPGTSSLTLTIPAPVYRGLELRDSATPSNPIANAVVRMFSTSNGTAVEVGRAITNASGRFDMYLDPYIQ